MIALEQPAQVAVAGRAPDSVVTAAFRQWRNATAQLANQLRAISQQFPADRTLRTLLAHTLQGAGQDDLALAEYGALAESCPPNEYQCIHQGIAQCQADRSYFPEVFAKRLSTGEFVNGQNAEVWRAYAWREIQRGREIVRLIRQVTTLRGKRVLDVGSGYGGMLLSMAEQGANVQGIEIDPERATMGRQRIRDLQMEIPYDEGDICDAQTCERLGTFDVIVCQDVLEHVLNPTRVIASLCRMLRPRGVVYFQIPNKYGIDQLMSDHHYALTGITALSRPQAIEYWQCATGELAEHYGVGYERGEKFYDAAFRRGGVALNPVERYSSPDHVAWYAAAVSQMCTRLEREIHPGLRPELQARIRRRMMLVARLYSHASEQVVALQNQPELLAAACDAIVRRLCLGLWRFIGIKNEGNPAA